MQKNKQQYAQKILQRLKKQYPNVGTALNYKTPMQFLVAVMLSAQATDEQVNKTTQELFQKYKSVNDFASAELKKFEKEISSVNFFRNKARHILQTARILKTQHKGTIPQTIDELVALPGVGRKTANVVLWEIHNKASGVVVDTHVKRVATRLGLTKNTDPEKIEQDLMAVYPQKEWGGIGHYFQAYGRNVMVARGKAKQDDCLKGFYE